MGKINSFTDLITWQEAHILVIRIYKLTDLYPNKSFSLVDQMRRSSVSITSNIAEGFSRRSSKEKIQFYYMSLGSLTELQNQLIISRDINYIKPTTYSEIEMKIIKVQKLLYGLIQSIKNSNQ